MSRSDLLFDRSGSYGLRYGPVQSLHKPSVAGHSYLGSALVDRGCQFVWDTQEDFLGHADMLSPLLSDSTTDIILSMTTTLAAVKQAIKVGATYDITNHYVTRVDHPCFGTRRQTVLRVNNTHMFLTPLTDDAWENGAPTAFPKRASQVEMDADGTIRFYGGGASQAPTDLFLTFKPVQE